MKTATLLKTALTLAILALLFLKVADISSFLRSLAETNWTIAALAMALCPVPVFLGVLRWRRILGNKIPLGKAHILYYIGMFYASVTPARLGELARGIAAANETGISRTRGVSSVILERGWDFTVAGTIVICFLVWQNAAFMFAAAAIISVPVYMSGFRAAAKLGQKVKFLKTIDLGQLSPGEGVLLSLLTCARWLVLTSVFWLVLQATGIGQVPFARAAMSVCLAAVALAVPLTVNGWGVREAVFIWALKPYAPAGAALGASVLFVLVTTYLAAAAGGILSLAENTGRLSTAKESHKTRFI